MFQCLNTSVISLQVSFEEALQLAATYNFAGVDLHLTELLQLADETSMQALKDRLRAAGVLPGGWGLPVQYNGPEDKYLEGLSVLPRYAELAQLLGSPWCSTWVLPFSDTLNYTENLAFHVQRLRPIAQILADHGCRLGLEFVGPLTLRSGHRYEFISTIDGALELGRMLGTGNTGLLLDAFHWYTSHGTTEDLAHLTAEQVVYVHVNDAPAGRSIDEQIDNQRLLPGASGIIDLTSFLQALHRIAYGGPVVVEPFNADLLLLPKNERVQAVKQSLDTIWSQAAIVEE